MIGEPLDLTVLPRSLAGSASHETSPCCGRCDRHSLPGRLQNAPLRYSHDAKVVELFAVINLSISIIYFKAKRIVGGTEHAAYLMPMKLGSLPVPASI